MAYWMQSVNGYDRAALGNIFESNMVAEPVITESFGDIMPVDFDPAEADRQVRLEIANAVSCVRQELFDAVSALNTKINLLSDNVAANDGFVKQTVDDQTNFILHLASFNVWVCNCFSLHTIRAPVSKR